MLLEDELRSHVMKFTAFCCLGNEDRSGEICRCSLVMLCRFVVIVSVRCNVVVHDRLA